MRESAGIPNDREFFEFRKHEDLSILISAYDSHSVIARLRTAVCAFYPSFGRFVLHNRDNHKGDKGLIDGARTQAHPA